MNGGDSNLGGPQVNPDISQPSPTTPSPFDSLNTGGSAAESGADTMVGSDSSSGKAIFSEASDTSNVAGASDLVASFDSPAQSSTLVASPTSPTPSVSSAPSSSPIASPGVPSSTLGPINRGSTFAGRNNYPVTRGYTDNFTNGNMMAMNNGYVASENMGTSGGIGKGGGVWKKVVIGVVVLLLLAGVGVGVWIGVGGEKGQEEVVVSGDFKQFMCYLIDECKQEFSAANYNPEDFYAIDSFYRIIYSERSQKYFDQLFDYWSSYMDDADEEDDLINSIDSSLKVLKLYADKPIMSEDIILQQYFDGGKDAADAYFIQYYPIDQPLISDEVLQFVAFQEEYMYNVISLAELYKQEGCITDNVLSGRCIDESGITDNNLYAKMKRSIENISEYTKNIKNDLKNVCSELLERGEDD